MLPLNTNQKSHSHQIPRYRRGSYCQSLSPRLRRPSDLQALVPTTSVFRQPRPDYRFAMCEIRAQDLMAAPTGGSCHQKRPYNYAPWRTHRDRLTVPVQPERTGRMQRKLIPSAGASSWLSETSAGRRTAR
jgi:hypothetical protein